MQRVAAFAALSLLSACASNGSGGMGYLFERYLLQNRSAETTSTIMNRVEQQEKKASQGQLPKPIEEPHRFEDFRA